MYVTYVFVVCMFLFCILCCVCMFSPSDKEERPWPITGGKIINQSINQSITLVKSSWIANLLKYLAR